MTTVPHLLTRDLDRLREDSQFAGAERETDAVELEELVLKAIQLHSRLDRQHERWAKPIREGRRPFSMDEGKSWQAAFQQWADETRRIIARARVYEQRGIHVDQLEELRMALMHCDYDGVDIEKLISSSEAFEAGRGIPGAEIRDEIRRRLRGSRERCRKLGRENDGGEAKDFLTSKLLAGLDSGKAIAVDARFASAKKRLLTARLGRKSGKSGEC